MSRAAQFAAAIRDAQLALVRDEADLTQRQAPHKAMLEEIAKSTLGERVKARRDEIAAARTIWASLFEAEDQAAQAARLAGTEAPDPFMPKGTSVQRRQAVSVTSLPDIPRSLLVPDMKAIKALPPGSVPGTESVTQYVLVCKGTPTT